MSSNMHMNPAGWKTRNEYLNSRNPFDSPNLSTSSLNESETSSNSGQDEFHLEKYNGPAKYAHLRQISKSTDGEEKERKPDLNIITNFAVPKMPMKDSTVVVNEVVAKRAQGDRKERVLSVISQKAIPSAVSPPDEAKNSPRIIGGGLKQLRLASRAAKRNNTRNQQLSMKEKQRSPSGKRMPFGITTPKPNTAEYEQNSAPLAFTPMTPAIIVTPAGESESWMIHRHGIDNEQYSASMYSTMPAQAPFKDVTIDSDKSTKPTKDTAEVSQEYLDVDSADSARPKSQGWWNLMLSPLLRAGSVASRKARQATDTAPVPPLPFTPAKEDFSAISKRSDPSFIMSATGTSPDTPRRLGLASARASTWSRWTEWEEEREANTASHSGSRSIGCEQAEHEPVDQLRVSNNATPSIGLATEYFHACAVEEATGRSYFECIGHSCLDQLPKLHSVYDEPTAKALLLGSPFQSPLPNEQTKVITGGEDKLVEVDTVKSPTVIEENLSPDGLSPNVREASTATAMRAKTLDILEQRGTPSIRDLKETTETRSDKAIPLNIVSYPPAAKNDDMPNIATIAPPPQLIEIKISHEPTSNEKSAFVEQPLASPTPLSPEGEKSLAPVNGVSMTNLDRKVSSPPTTTISEKSRDGEALPQRPAFINSETEFPPPPERKTVAPITAADIFLTDRARGNEKRRRRQEREDATAKKVGGLWRGRGCFSNMGCMGRGGAEHRTRRRWILAIILLLLAIIITSIVVAITLTRGGDHTPAQSQWLNLTGYPPMPTGITTIAAPNLNGEQKQCVAPSTMWSCSVPKEEQGKTGANDADQPNFRFEIKFRNGTVPANMTIPTSGQPGNTKPTSSDPFSNDLFVPNPTPPNQADQSFLGRSTDNVTTPFDGEKTPFYITFMSAWPQVPNGRNSSKAGSFKKRDSNSSLIQAIPAPAKAADGSAAPASLLPTDPFPISQPVKLYNRGLRDEHYGFYVYYDKTIYLSGVKISGNTPANGSTNPADTDQDGGSLKSQANAMCTFSQTRFLFKIFTNPAFGATLLPSSTNTTSTKSGSTSSATNFNAPGSFPYPATIVLDRHGGDIDSKAIYCYGMSNGNIIDSAKILAGELRGIGGQLVNAAPGIIDTGSDNFNTTAGGIDGGTGGCFCNWQNWQ